MACCMGSGVEMNAWTPVFRAVFVLDTGFHVFVWVGKEATSHEKGGGLVIAHVSDSTASVVCCYWRA